MPEKKQQTPHDIDRRREERLRQDGIIGGRYDDNEPPSCTCPAYPAVVDADCPKHATTDPAARAYNAQQRRA